MSSEEPVVSVAIRAYRRETVPAAIESVLAQAHRQLELVVYDDARSLDDVVASYRDPRIRYHRATQRHGASGRFLAALALCRGELIAFLDDDDRYEPSFLDRLITPFADPAVGFAFCRAQWEVDGAIEPTRDALPGGRVDHLASDLVRMRYTVPPSRMVIRRQALDEALTAQPMPDGVWPDVFVTTAMGALGWDAVHVPEGLVTCGWHAGQVSRAVGSHDMAIATWRALRFDDPAIEDLRRASLARALVGRAAHHIARGDRSAGAADLADAATASPAAWRRGRRVLATAARLGAFGRVGVAVVIARRERRRRPAVQT